MKIVCAFQDAPSQLGEAQQKWKLKQELLTHPSIADGPWVRVLQRKEEAATDELLLLLLLTDANCSFRLPQLPQHLSSTNWRGPLKKALNTYTYVKMGNNETSQAKNTQKTLQRHSIRASSSTAMNSSPSCPLPLLYSRCGLMWTNGHAIKANTNNKGMTQPKLTTFKIHSFQQKS